MLKATSAMMSAGVQPVRTRRSQAFRKAVFLAVGFRHSESFNHLGQACGALVLEHGSHREFTAVITLIAWHAAVCDVLLCPRPPECDQTSIVDAGAPRREAFLGISAVKLAASPCRKYRILCSLKVVQTCPKARVCCSVECAAKTALPLFMIELLDFVSGKSSAVSPC